MSAIKAKEIKSNYWILQQNKKKIGDMQEYNSKYTIHIPGHNTLTLNTKQELQDVNIQFVTLPKQKAKKADNVEGYATTTEAFNAVWNLHYKLPMFTEEEESKSWHCAGYYKITLENKIVVEFCPKFITLQRNHYQGPYKTKPDLNLFRDIF